ncbi:MAG TPA: class I SAM-dependent methyltransferase [Gemmatimonadaceae bacterium]|nr:class I SAM-dependent methyltransferase [Gemmatimonadaceae bacterium]
MNFRDHFSERASLYAAYRPRYPDALFNFVARLTSEHKLALDCGTGNGQAAIGLAGRFDKVVATDPSTEQIKNATPHPKIEYRVAQSEASGLPTRSVNLVTAAQALHWFVPERFFAEAKRVLVADGAVAVWGYGDPMLDGAPLQEILHEYNRVLLEPYWAPERQLLLDGYRSIHFPFEEVAAPSFELRMNWTLPELAGYLRTWSATANYVSEHRTDPVARVEKALATHWGDPRAARVIRWPLHIRAGKLQSRLD